MNKVSMGGSPFEGTHPEGYRNFVNLKGKEKIEDVKKNSKVPSGLLPAVSGVLLRCLG
jgi:hypothetical protein